MSIVTDSSGERPANVYAIHKLFKADAELETLYSANKGNYKALKEALIEEIEAFVAPMRERRENYAKDLDSVKKVLEEGSEKAREMAEKKMTAVREKVGVTI